MAKSLLQLKSEFKDKFRAGIVDMLWKSSLVMQRMNFISHNSMAYPYTKRSRLPGVAFRSLNENFIPTNGVTNPDVETLSILGGSIRTDSIMIEQKGSAARTNEIAAQMQAAGKFYDKNFFHGDPTLDPRSFYGLRKRLAGSQLITNAVNGDVVDYNNVIRLLDAVEGPNSEKVLFMNRIVRRDLSKDVGADAGGRNVMDVGNQLVKFEGATIVEVFKDEAEAEILQFNETCGSANDCSSIYCVHFGGNIDEQGVQGISGLKETIMARGPYEYGTYTEDVVQMVGGLGLFSGYCAARLQGVKAGS